jgi:ATP-dependent RNA helicase DDX41
LPTHPAIPPRTAADGWPELRTLLAIGGVDMKAQADQIRNTGVHMVVATPGRLKDMLT